MRKPTRPKYQPPQVTLLQAAEALLERLEECTFNGLSATTYSLYGEAEVLRRAIQREKAK